MCWQWLLEVWQWVSWALEMRYFRWIWQKTHCLILPKLIKIKLLCLFLAGYIRKFAIFAIVLLAPMMSVWHHLTGKCKCLSDDSEKLLPVLPATPQSGPTSRTMVRIFSHWTWDLTWLAVQWTWCWTWPRVKFRHFLIDTSQTSHKRWLQTDRLVLLGTLFKLMNEIF